MVNRLPQDEKQPIKLGTGQKPSEMVKSPKEYLLAAMQARQKKPGTWLTGNPTKRDEELLLVAGAALQAMETDYLALLKKIAHKAQHAAASAKGLNQG